MVDASLIGLLIFKYNNMSCLPVIEKDLSSLPQNKAKFGKFYNNDITLDKDAKIVQQRRNCLYKWILTV